MRTRLRSRALPEFFIKAFSDKGDIIFDPFLGSGTTIAAAHGLHRTGYGLEISPAYCDVILRRIGELTGRAPVLAGTKQRIAAVAAERGVPQEQVDNPRLRDSRRIQHHGPAPFYGAARLPDHLQFIPFDRTRRKPACPK